MSAPPCLRSTLAQLTELLGAQAEAMREGKVDELPALADALNRNLALLRSTPVDRNSPAARQHLLVLRDRAAANLQVLHARQLDVDRALGALGAGNPVLQNAQSMRVYAAAGHFAAPAMRGRGFAKA